MSALQRKVIGLNDKLSTSDASFAKSKAKGKEMKHKIKSLTKSVDNLHAEVAYFFADLNRATILEAKKDEEILRLKATPPAFVSFFQGQFQALVRIFLASDEFSRVQVELLASAGFECGLSMHRTKEEFSAIFGKISQYVPGAQGRLTEASSLVAQTDYDFLNKISEHAIEPLSIILQLEPKKFAHPNNVPASRNARVSPPFAKESTITPASASLELPSDTALASSVAALEPNEVSHTLDADGDLVVEGLRHVSSGPFDVLVALSVREKNDDPPSSFGVKEVAAPPFGA
ncbi:hypothetical protein Tco_1296825 [Tanacetum coccineum]